MNVYVCDFVCFCDNFYVLFSELNDTDIQRSPRFNRYRFLSSLSLLVEKLNDVAPPDKSSQSYESSLAI